MIFSDMRDVDLTKIHYLTGPFEIETAEPGDILVVEIQDVQPLEEQPWGFTGVFSKKNGGVSAFLRKTSSGRTYHANMSWNAGLLGRDLPGAVSNSFSPRTFHIEGD